MGESVKAEPLIRTSMQGSVLLAVIDMPGRAMNVFSWALMDALEAVLDRVEGDPAVAAVVFTSGKPSFLAGADLEMVRGFTEGAGTLERPALHARTGRLGRMFVRLEAMAKPSVAAVNGLALGGGLELAMACGSRVVADDPRLQLGLPEVKLGLLPGAGGTQRLPRLVGAERGLELLLNGRSVAPEEAKALGLTDATAPAAEVVERAVAMAEARARQPAARRLPVRLDPGPFDFAAPDAVARILRHFGYAEAVTAKYPAYTAITRAVVEGADLPIAEGGEVEMARFVDLMYDPVAGNMVTTLFINRQRADKLLSQARAAKGLRVAVQGDGPASDALRAALGAAKAVLADVAQADIVVGPAGTRPADLVLVADAAPIPSGSVGVFLGQSAQYGMAMEIIGAGEARAKALTLARLLRATPYVHGGTRSLLAQLAAVDAAALEAKAAAAAQFEAEGLAGDTALADVATVVSGTFPAYAGGPFRYLRQRGEHGV